MHCQNYLFIICLLILSVINLIKAEHNLNSITTESSLLNDEITDKTLIFEPITTTDKVEDTHQSNQTINELNSLNSQITKSSSNNNSSSASTRSILGSLSSSLSNLFTNSNSSSIIDTILTTTTIAPDLTTESLVQDEKQKTEETNNKCLFLKIITSDLIEIEPKILPKFSSDRNTFPSPCLKSEHLNLTDVEAKFNETFDKLDNETVYSLNDFIDKDYDNVLQIKLQPSSFNSFKLLLNWTKVNQTQSDLNYGILMTIYENLVSTGKLFITDQLKSKQLKELIFKNLNNMTYSISLSSVVYFRTNFSDYLKSNQQIYEVPDKQIYLIKNVYQAMQTKNEQLSTSQVRGDPIMIYIIGSLLLLVLICVLLYYRRNKFKSLIKHTSSPVHQNSKYLRHKNTPAINISNYENQAFHDSAFEDRFLKNTAQLNYTDRSNAFSYRNNRDKLSLSKSNIGRVLENSVATIKKRTILKSINPTTVEIDLKNMDTASRYSQAIPLMNFLPLIHELNKNDNRRLYNEFMQLNILSNCSETIKKSNKVARSSKNIQKNKDGCILPFDHSRIILEQNKFLTSDYINASYVAGITSPKEYIACQCPLKSTIYSFWLMCLQQNVKYIVMTTQLIDSYTTMDKYWPDIISEDGECIKQIENITIKLRNKRKFQYFILRIFEVKMNDETKVIKHYQLTDWIEIAGQQNIIMMTSFIELFRDEVGYKENCLNDSPIVVNCATGVGKTAVFIAIDRIYVQLKKGKDDYIDIFKTVFEMRQYRPLMVQNETQYRFIYDCIGHLVSKLYPPLVKQMEFDSQLDEINLKETNDFDTNNNLELNSSFNSQISLFNMLKNSTSRPIETKKLNGYTNQTFIPEKSPC